MSIAVNQNSVPAKTYDSMSSWPLSFCFTRQIYESRKYTSNRQTRLDSFVKKWKILELLERRNSYLDSQPKSPQNFRKVAVSSIQNASLVEWHTKVRLLAGSVPRNFCRGLYATFLLTGYERRSDRDYFFLRRHSDDVAGRRSFQLLLQTSVHIPRLSAVALHTLRPLRLTIVRLINGRLSKQ